jgi:hypothetical protein
MAELRAEQVGRFERTAPGFQGAVLLREGANLLASSCWDGQGPAEAALAPLLDRMASSSLDRRSWRVRVVARDSGAVARSEWFDDEATARRRHGELDATAFRSRYRPP